MAARKPVIEIALSKLAVFIGGLKDKDRAEKLAKSHPGFMKRLRQFLDIDGNGMPDASEIDQGRSTVARLAPLASDFVRMQQNFGLGLEEPAELVARVGEMLRDPNLDRSKLNKLYTAFVEIDPKKVSRIGLLVENSPAVVIDALMRYEVGDLKAASRTNDNLVVHARASGER
jgi:hypothetical protein